MTAAQECLAVGVRQLTRLPLDDCHFLLRAFVPRLSRPTLHRCYSRHRLARLPDAPRHTTQAGWFDVRAMEIDAGSAQCPVRCLFIAVEHNSRYVIARLYEQAAADAASDFIAQLRDSSPLRVCGLHVERRGLRAPVDRALARACTTNAMIYRRVAASWSREQLAALDELTREALREHEGLSAEALRGTLEKIVEHYNDRCRMKSLGGKTPAAAVQAAVAALPAASIEVDDAEHMEPGERDARDETREIILRCARSLLAVSGPEGLSLAKVARMAGVNRGTIYHNFKSRSQLLAAAAEWSSRQLTQAVFGNAPPTVPRKEGQVNVVPVISRLVDFAMRNPGMGQAWLFQVLSMPDPSKDEFWREYSSRSERFHDTPMSADNIDGEVLSVVLLAGSLLWPIWARAKADPNADMQRYVDRFTNEIARLAYHGTVKVKP